MSKNLNIKIFFGLLCLTIIAWTNNTVVAQRKGSGSYAATLEVPLSESDRALIRRSKRAAAEAVERERRRRAAEHRRAEARNREYARRKRVADAINKRNSSYAVRKSRPSTNRRSSRVYRPSNRREIQVTVIPNYPN